MDVPKSDDHNDQQPVKEKTEDTPPPRPPPPTHDTTPNPTPSLPMLKARHMTRCFSRKDSDYFTVVHTVRVSAQETMPSLVYDIMQSITTEPMLLTKQQFTRMWKTLLLKRAQDAYESAYSRRPDHFIRLTRNMIIPGPLGDLLHSIGYFHSTRTGRHHRTVQPAKSATPEDFWTVDSVTQDTWNLEMNRFKNIYTMKEYPSTSQCDERPMMLCQVSSYVEPLRIVKAATCEPKQSDAFVLMMQDKLYDDQPVTNYDRCRLVMTSSINVDQLRREYVHSYVIEDNS